MLIVLAVAAIFTRVELLNSPGGSLLPSRSLRCSFSLQSVGCSPNHHVGSLRLVAKMRLVISLVAFVVRPARMWARPKRSFRTSAISQSSNARRQKLNLTYPCSSVSVLANSTLDGAYNLLSGYRSCRNGLVLPV